MHCNTFVIRTSVEHYIPRLTGAPLRRSILICNILTNIGADWVFYLAIRRYALSQYIIFFESM